MFYYDKHKKNPNPEEGTRIGIVHCFVSGLRSVISLTPLNFHDAEYQSLHCRTELEGVVSDH